MASFLLELYSEEIKYEFFNSILKNTKKVLNETFFDLGLIKDKKDSNFELYTTSCRIIIYSNKIKDNIKISHREICGPKLDATNEEINGFLSAYNLNSIKELSKNDTNYILVQENLEINSKDILLNNITNILYEIASSFPENIDWNSPIDTKWISPLRNILCLFNNDVLNFEFSDVKSSNYTYGHKTLIGLDKKIKVKDFEDYKNKLIENFVIYNQNERKKIILDKLTEIEKEHNLSVYGKIDDINYKEKIINKIVNTLEYPNIFLTEFNEEFLKLPDLITITTICDYYDCLCLYDKNKNHISNKIISFFNINISNNKKIIDNLKNIINNRLSFINLKLTEYLSENLDTKFKELKELPYHRGFGSVFDKCERVMELSKFICLWIPNCDLLEVEQAAKLIKIDLTTTLIKDNPLLRGYLSSYYAKKNGYSKNIYDAIAEYYEPRNLYENIPSTNIGKIISIAGRLDNIITLVITNEIATSSNDPFGIRKNINAIIKIMIEGKIAIPFQALLNKSISLFKTGIYKQNNEEKISIKQKIVSIENNIIELCKDRLFNYLIYLGYHRDVINYVFDKDNKRKKRILNIYAVYLKLSVLNDFIKNNKDKFTKIKNTYKRINGILNNNNKNLFSIFDKITKNLYKPTQKEVYLNTKIKEIKIDMKKAYKIKDYNTCINLLFDLAVLLDNYLSKNKILSKNIFEKEYKVYLLNKTKKIFDSFLYLN